MIFLTSVELTTGPRTSTDPYHKDTKLELFHFKACKQILSIALTLLLCSIFSIIEDFMMVFNFKD